MVEKHRNSAAIFVNNNLDGIEIMGGQVHLTFQNIFCFDLSQQSLIHAVKKGDLHNVGVQLSKEADPNSVDKVIYNSCVTIL
jgi:hypothetical protein